MATDKRIYSLSELLVFVALITLILSVSTTMLFAAQDDARVSKAKADVLTFKRVALMATVEKGMSIKKLTGEECSSCKCTSLIGDECLSSNIESLRKLVASTNGVIHASESAYFDPWGSPYLITESGSELNGICTAKIFSAGGDRNPLNQEDNIIALIEESC